MTLVIDPGAFGLMLLLLDDKKNIVAKTLVVATDGRHRVIRDIVRLCRSNKISLGDMSSIGIVQRRGSYTNVRQATSVANTLRWLTSTRLFALDAFPETMRYYKAPRARYLVPEYHSEPNITNPKS